MVGAWSEYKDEHEADEADWNVSLCSFVILIIIITIFIIVKIIQNIMTIVLIGPKIDTCQVWLEQNKRLGYKQQP